MIQFHAELLIASVKNRKCITKNPPHFWQKYARISFPLFCPWRILLHDYYRVDAPGSVDVDLSTGDFLSLIAVWDYNVLYCQVFVAVRYYRLAAVERLPDIRVTTCWPCDLDLWPLKLCKLSVCGTRPVLFTFWGWGLGVPYPHFMAAQRSEARHLLSESLSVCPSVCLSVRFSVCLSHSWVTPEGSRYRNTVHFIPSNRGTFLFLAQISLSWIYGFTTEFVKDRHPLSTAKIGPIIRTISGMLQDMR